MTTKVLSSRPRIICGETKKEDAVKDKGCPSWLTLATALKKLEKSHNTPTIKGK